MNRQINDNLVGILNRLSEEDTSESEEQLEFVGALAKLASNPLVRAGAKSIAKNVAAAAVTYAATKAIDKAVKGAAKKRAGARPGTTSKRADGTYTKQRDGSWQKRK